MLIVSFNIFVTNYLQCTIFVLSSSINEDLEWSQLILFLCDILGMGLVCCDIPPTVTAGYIDSAQQSRENS